MSTQPNRRHAIPTLTLIALLTATGPLQAAPPLLPFQGRLTDADGAAVPDGARVVQFKMYDAPVSGQTVWIGEVHKLTVNRGLVNTILGSKAGLDQVDFNEPVYLELTIDANGDDAIDLADPPLLPRQSILPAVFAYEAADSRLLDGFDWGALLEVDEKTPPTRAKMSGDRLVSGSVTSNQIALATITADRLAEGAVTAEKITEHSMPADRLMTNSVTGIEIRTNAVDRVHLADRVREAIMPAGAIVPFAGPDNRIPAGWLLCNGAAKKSRDYAELHAAIGTFWGDGGKDEKGDTVEDSDGSIDFNLPDLRGYFLRGLDPRAAGQGKDTESPRDLGSEQKDEFRSHKHRIGNFAGAASNGPWDRQAYFGGGTFSFETEASGGRETRPINRAVNYIIKY